MQQFDILIIGAGPGGYETAIEAAKAGRRVALVDSHKLGGTCLNVGCIPTKCLCHTADLLRDARNQSSAGVENMAEPVLNLSQAVARKNDVVAQLIAGIAMQLKKVGVSYLQGHARFLSANEVAVESEGTETVIQATDIIIATGSESAILPIEGVQHPKVLTSTEMLDLEEVPERLCIIGGGVIGMEFASIFNTFGSRVTVVEFCKEILPPFDKDIAKRLRLSLKKSGIEFLTGSQVTAIRDNGANLEVAYLAGENTGAVEADFVLMAVGRRAKLESLNLDDIGVTYTRKGILVDENFQTNIPHVYAIGDITGLMQLAHAATFHGKTALAHILQADYPIRHEFCPAVVFTHPEIAMIGKTEEQLKSEGIAYNVRKVQYGAVGRALTMAETEGLMKVYTAEDGQILGVHIMGSRASELIHEAAVVMNANLTIDYLKHVIHAHPTLSELFLMV